MGKHPVQNNNKKKKVSTTSFCLAYENDIEQAYAFYCARYENISYEDFLQLGINELNMKLSSIPEDEPLFKIIKSRIINTSKIKDKEERKYWNELKRINAIPDLYISREELDYKLNEYLKNGGNNQWKKN